MKRIFFILFSLLVLSGNIFAQTQGDVYDDGYVYEQNGNGDQHIKINLDFLFPCNFDGQLNTGGAIEIGYYRFLNSWLALGGDFMASYNVSIGNKILVMIPFTFGALFQPTYEKFEFPIYVTAGFAYETWQNMNYFPSFVFKTSAGAYYRLNELCSLGINTTWLAATQTTEDSSKNFCANFITLSIGARYHF